MPHAGLSVTLAALLALGPAVPQSQSLVPPVERFARRLAEHGPIRRSLEATLGSPFAQTGADALGVSLGQVRSALGVRSREARASQPTMQGPTGSTNYLKTLLLLAILLATAVVVLVLTVED